MLVQHLQVFSHCLNKMLLITDCYVSRADGFEYAWCVLDFVAFCNMSVLIFDKLSSPIIFVCKKIQCDFFYNSFIFAIFALIKISKD